MGISRVQIEEQLTGLQKQEEYLVRQMQEIQGAQRMCRHLLGLLDRQQDKARCEQAQENGGQS